MSQNILLNGPEGKKKKKNSWNLGPAFVPYTRVCTFSGISWGSRAATGRGGTFKVRSPEDIKDPDCGQASMPHMKEFLIINLSLIPQPTAAVEDHQLSL